MPRSLNEGFVKKMPLGLSLTWLNNIWLASLGFLISFFMQILTKLLFRQSQVAEYLADRLAANVCGHEAMISMLHKLLHDHGYGVAVQRAAISNRNRTVFEEFQASRTAPSDHYLEGQRRLSLRRGLSLDATHPPIPYRIRYIENSPVSAKVTLSQIDRSRIESEIQEFRERISDEEIDRYRDGLYQS